MDIDNNELRNTRPRQLPVGTSDFKEMTENFYIVDKSLFIKDILDNGSKVFLFPRPRRFGKTSAMSMLKYFFEKKEEDNSGLFKDLEIWRQGESYRKEQGSSPVIFITLKDVKCNSWKDTYRSLSEIIKALYGYYEKDLLEGQLNTVQREHCLRIINGTGDLADFENSLARLTEYLNKIYCIKPILLIDEYDIPIQQSHIKDFYEDVISFMRNWLSGGLKDNVNLRFAVLTGILRVAKESIFSGLNNLEVYTVLDEPFRQYFGFTQGEVERLAGDYGCSDKLLEIKDWYDGYYFGSLDMYNPWSVLLYVKNKCKAETYWLRTSSNDIIGELLDGAVPDIQNALKTLLDGKPYYTDIDTNIVYPEVFKKPKAIFSFLVMSGYLKVKKQELAEGYYDYELRIPNREISIAYRTEIVERLSMEYGKFSGYINEFMKAVYRGNTKEIERLLRQVAEYSMSYHDTHALKDTDDGLEYSHNEGFYHGWMLSLTGLFLDTHYITSNRETGDGRADLLLEPKKQVYPGVIFEFKVLGKDEVKGDILEQKLEAEAKKGYDQIQKKDYEAEFRKRGIETIYKFGVAFYKKKLAVYGEAQRVEEHSP